MNTNRKRVIAWAIAGFLVIVAMLTVCGASSAQARGRHHDFRSRATIIRGHKGLAGRSKFGRCYRFHRMFRVENWTGSVKYLFGPDVTYCNNRANSKIAVVREHFCKHGDGFFQYDRCKRSRGALGLDRLSIYDEWRYHVSIIVTIRRSPTVEARMGLSGRVVGTVYYN